MAEQQPSIPEPQPDPPSNSVADASAPPADLSAAAVAAAPGDAADPHPATESDLSEPALEDINIEDLLKQAAFEDPASIAGSAALPDAEQLKLQDFQQVMQDAQVSSIDLLRDVDLNVKIELGRSRMLVEDVLKLAEGSVVELDKLAGDPVDVFVNERLVARGEVLVLNDNFCVRINEIVAGIKEEG